MNRHVDTLKATQEGTIQNWYVADADGGAYWRNLANTIEPSVSGGDVAFCQITLTTSTLTSTM